MSSRNFFGNNKSRGGRRGDPGPKCTQNNCNGDICNKSEYCKGMPGTGVCSCVPNDPSQYDPGPWGTTGPGPNRPCGSNHDCHAGQTCRGGQCVGSGGSGYDMGTPGYNPGTPGYSEGRCNGGNGNERWMCMYAGPNGSWSDQSICIQSCEWGTWGGECVHECDCIQNPADCQNTFIDPWPSCGGVQQPGPGTCAY